MTETTKELKQRRIELVQEGVVIVDKLLAIINSKDVRSKVTKLSPLAQTSYKEAMAYIPHTIEEAALLLRLDPDTLKKEIAKVRKEITDIADIPVTDLVRQIIAGTCKIQIERMGLDILYSLSVGSFKLVKTYEEMIEALSENIAMGIGGLMPTDNDMALYRLIQLEEMGKAEAELDRVTAKGKAFIDGRMKATSKERDN